jgi:hypothetical protein
MDWCSVYLTPQALSKYIYLSPPLIFPTTSTELGQQTARCESLRALLHYVKWVRIVTLAGSKSGLRVTLSYLANSLPLQREFGRVALPSVHSNDPTDPLHISCICSIWKILHFYSSFSLNPSKSAFFHALILSLLPKNHMLCIVSNSAHAQDRFT